MRRAFLLIAVIAVAGITVLFVRGSRASRADLFLPLEASEVWRADREPWVVLGSSETERGHDLHGVSGAALLSDSLVLVANRSGHDVRLFDRSGRFKVPYGGRGIGPENYAFVGRVSRMRDGNLAVVVGPREYALFDPSGSEIDRVTLTSGYRHTDSRAESAVVLANGGMLAEDDFERPETGTFRVLTNYVVLPPHDSAVQPFGSFPGMVHIATKETTVVQGFSPDTYISQGKNFVAVADSKRLSVTLYGFDGTQVGGFSHALKPVRVTERHRRQSRERFAQARPFAREAPFFDAMVVDNVGNIWLRESSLHDPQIWFVFDPNGRVVARAEMPPFRRIFEITEDEVLALTVDDLDVQQVVIHKLNRRGRDG